MNIEQAIKIAKESGGTLIGFHSIPLPVYQVLLDYDTIDDNPFFPIQKAILQYVDKLANIEKEEGAQWSFDYLAAVLGLDVSLVNKFYEELKEEHLIYRNPENQLLTIMPFTRKEYLAEGSKPHKRLTGSILVDGKSFELFSEEIYDAILNSNEVWASEHTNNITPHLPIDLSQKDTLPEALNLISGLNSHQKMLKSIGLEHSEGSNFEIKGLVKKFLYGVYLVYIQTKDGSLRKIPYVGHIPMKSASLSNVSNYRFSLKTERNQKSEKNVIVTANLGYNSNEDSKHRSVEGSEELWVTLIGDILGVPEEYAKSAIKTDLFGNKCILVNKDLLIHSDNPSKILDDALKPTPRVCIALGGKGFNEKGILLIRIEFDDDLCPYLEIKKAINNTSDIQQLKELLYQVAPKDWRQRLVEIAQYSKLEEIDCSQYIHPLQ